MHKNKRKGNTLEQQVVRDLRIKYPFAKTTREGSKLLDDSKIDVLGVPFLIQIKSGYNKPRLKYEELYLDMKELIKKNFPEHHPVHKLPYILINKLNRRLGGTKSQPEMSQVVLQYDFFLELLEHYKTSNVEI